VFARRRIVTVIVIVTVTITVVVVVVVVFRNGTVQPGFLLSRGNADESGSNTEWAPTVLGKSILLRSWTPSSLDVARRKRVWRTRRW